MPNELMETAPLESKKVDSSNTIRLSDTDYLKLSNFIKKNYGINLTASKRILLESRLQKHLRQTSISSFKDYIKKVCDENDKEELVNMMNVVSTNKTDFYREKSHFEYLSTSILPQLMESNGKKEISIWSAAASSGEEVYTIAMVMEEYKKLTGRQLNCQIDGTDISTSVLKKAIQAVYTNADVALIPNEIKQTYFLRGKDINSHKVRVIKRLREKAKFYHFNLMSNKYPSRDKYDIIFCRNVLIYFDRPTQEAVITKLCKSLKSNGYLFLGHSESILGLDVPLKQVIHTGYQKII
jgi:chemotaxis protein methyltransferase CheR